MKLNHCFSLIQEAEQQGVRFLVSDHVPGEDPEGEPERQRLHRRDTPHHLKNKRINQQQLWVRS